MNIPVRMAAPDALAEIESFVSLTTFCAGSTISSEGPCRLMLRRRSQIAADFNTGMERELAKITSRAT
ncbi:hypothetical protein [Herbaspirillum rhizosphaerae]|uniref:hypothetical protein n=1 Tax=Herbaspirillum rhizosphaerae TaxID=346179 RepID=UPI00142F38DB|nr:hypothetical protein [Herbaspirillum rhizosphaerae]